MVRDRLVAFLFRVSCFLFTLIGLITELNILKGEFAISKMVYYTLQSNLLALILFAVLTVRTAKAWQQDGRIGKTGYFARFEMICVVDLLLTLTVFWVLLAPDSFSMGGEYSPYSFQSLTTHLFTPLLCLPDYIFFTESGHLKYKDVYFVLIYPLSYLVLTSTAGLLGYVYRMDADGIPVHFPYFFYDFERIGTQALLYIGALVMFFLLLSHGFYLFDKKVKKHAFLPK